jgi:iron complex outermembrane receptor protein
MKRVVYPLLLLGAVSFGKDVELKEVSVTATRTERKTEDVPASVSVIGKEKIQNKPMLNLYDALQGVPGVNIASRNQGYDTRLIIRGARVKGDLRRKGDHDTAQRRPYHRPGQPYKA